MFTSSRSRHRDEAYRWQKSLRDPLTFPFFVWMSGRKQIKEQGMSHILGKRRLERRHDVCNGDEGEKNDTILKMYLYGFVPPTFITAQKHVEY